MLKPFRTRLAGKLAFATCTTTILLCLLPGCGSAPARPSQLITSPVGTVFVPASHLQPLSVVLPIAGTNQIATASEDGSVILWDQASELGIAKFTVAKSPITSLSYDPEQELLYVLSPQEGVTAISLKHLAILKRFPQLAGGAKAIALSTNQLLLVGVYADSTAVAVSTQDDQVHQRYRSLQAVGNSFSTLDNGFLAQTARGDLGRWHWDSTQPTSIIRPHPAEGQLISYAYRGKTLALFEVETSAAKEQLHLKIGDLSKQEQTIWSFPYNSSKPKLVLSSDGSWVAFYYRGLLWHGPTDGSATFQTIDPQQDDGAPLAIMPDNKGFVLGKRALNLGLFSTGLFYQHITACKKQYQIRLGYDWNYALTVWPQASRTAFYLWNFGNRSTEARVFELIAGADLLWAFCNNGDFLQILDQQELTLVSSATGKIFSQHPRALLREALGIAESDRITALDITPNGRYSALGTNSGKILVWDNIFGGLISTVAGNKTSVSELHYSPNGSFLLTTDAQGAIFIHDGESGKRLRRLSQGQYNYIDLSFDGQYAMASSAEYLTLFQTYSWEKLGTYRGDRFYFQQDNTAVFISDQGTISQISLQNGSTISSFNLAYPKLHDFFLRSDGRYLMLRPSEAELQMEAWNPQEGKQVLNIAPFENGSWLAIAPNGNFSTTQLGRQHLYLYTHKDRTINSSNLYLESLFNPDYIAPLIRNIFGKQAESN